MAKDLIPPPSPAGQPDPDAGRRQGEHLREAPRRGGADDLVLAVRPDDGEPAAAERQEAAERVEAPHRSRFGLILGALIGLGLAAVVLLVVSLAGRDSSVDEARWSNWRPISDDKYIAVSEIADHVAREYRLDDGSQLVDIESGPIEINDVPLTVILREQTEKGDVLQVGEDGVWFVFNGLGERGSISRGKASPERLALVKREALELALYTFRYVDGIDHIVTLLPPPPPAAAAKAGAKSSSSASDPGTASPATTTDTLAGEPLPAMLFRPEQLGQQLSLPLALTLDPKTPKPKSIKPRDATLITQFTAPSTFNASIEQDQIGSAFLVLERPKNLLQLQDQIKPAP
jgi:hypothetical protein